MLKEIFRTKFGKELRISGGAGSQNDPIILEEQTPHDASYTEMELANYNFAFFGMHWRYTERTRIGKIERLTCDVIFPEDDQIITQRQNLYFDVSNIQLGEDEINPVCGINLGFGTGIGLPYQLCWLHFKYLTDYESTRPGMGVSAAYSSPYTEATIYVYNKGLSGFQENRNELLKQEFLTSLNEIKTVQKDLKILAEKFDDNLMFTSFDIGDSYSILTLSIMRNHFFKIRITMSRSNDEYVFKCLWESLHYILDMLKSKIH